MVEFLNIHTRSPVVKRNFSNKVRNSKIESAKENEAEADHVALNVVTVTLVIRKMCGELCGELNTSHVHDSLARPGTRRYPLHANRWVALSNSIQIPLRTKWR